MQIVDARNPVRFRREGLDQSGMYWISKDREERAVLGRQIIEEKKLITDQQGWSLDIWTAVRGGSDHTLALWLMNNISDNSGHITLIKASHMHFSRLLMPQLYSMYGERPNSQLPKSRLAVLARCLPCNVGNVFFIPWTGMNRVQSHRYRSTFVSVQYLPRDRPQSCLRAIFKKPWNFTLWHRHHAIQDR